MLVSQRCYYHLIPKTPNLLWNLLTKRSTEIKRYLPELQRLPNVRIGVTVENQTYDHRIVDGVQAHKLII